MGRRVFVLATAFVLAISSAALARGGPGGHGASGFAPGQQFREFGPVSGYPGASGYAPGHLKRLRGRGAYGASAYAPGHQFRHRTLRHHRRF
jgi:hypothetical protein